MEVWYTLGPSSLECTKDLLRAGATGVRLTFSFGTAQLQIERATALRAAAESLQTPLALVGDLAGSKPRLGEFSDGSMRREVALGERATFALNESLTSEHNFPVRRSGQALFSQTRVGDQLVIGDRAAVFRVTGVTPTAIDAEALHVGVVEQNRGVAVMGPLFNPFSLTEKDREDLREIVASELFDWVAISFCSSAKDVQEVRDIVDAFNSRVRILAKIESQTGIDHLQQIAQVADGLMAARGDLSISLPSYKLSAAVAAVGDAARRVGKPWILATQVMESGEHLPYPTAAEICDLSRWLGEGAAGVLLSRETVFGPQPIQAVRFVAEMASSLSRN